MHSHLHQVTAQSRVDDLRRAADAQRIGSGSAARPRRRWRVGLARLTLPRGYGARARVTA